MCHKSATSAMGVLRAIDVCMLLVAVLSAPSVCSSLSSTHWPPAPPDPELALAAAPLVVHQLPLYHLNPRQKPPPSHAAVPPSYNLHPPLPVVLDRHRQSPLPLPPPLPTYVYHRPPTDGQSPPAPPMGSDQLPSLPQTPPSYLVHEPVPVPPTGYPRKPPSPPVHVIPTVEPPSHWPRHRPQSKLPPPYKTIPEQRPPLPQYAYPWPPTHGRPPPPPPPPTPLPRLQQAPPSYKAPPPLVNEPVPVPPTVYPKKPPQPPVHVVPIVESPSHWPRHRQHPILPPPYKMIPEQWPPLPPYAYPWPSTHGRSLPPPPPPSMDHAPLPRLPQTPPSYKAPPPLVHEPVPVPPTVYPKKPPQPPVHVIPTVEPPSQWPRHRPQPVPPPPYKTNTEHPPPEEPEYNLPPSPYF